MLGLLIISVIIGGIVAAVTDIGFLFWIVAGFIFVSGLPFALINSFIDDKIDRVQDREDERENMRQIREDLRMQNYLNKIDESEYYRKPDVYIDNRQYNDNRQVHYYDRKNKKGANRISQNKK